VSPRLSDHTTTDPRAPERQGGDSSWDNAHILDYGSCPPLRLLHIAWRLHFCGIPSRAQQRNQPPCPSPTRTAETRVGASHGQGHHRAKSYHPYMNRRRTKNQIYTSGLPPIETCHALHSTLYAPGRAAFGVVTLSQPTHQRFRAHATSRRQRCYRSIFNCERPLPTAPRPTTIHQASPSSRTQRVHTYSTTSYSTIFPVSLSGRGIPNI
jgi:hypothetical protein